MKRIALLIRQVSVVLIGLFFFAGWTEFQWRATVEETHAATKATVRKIDLNTATLRELERLPGFGPELAKRVVQHRPYHKLDELIAKKVLGRKQFARIKEQIRVNSAQPKDVP